MSSTFKFEPTEDGFSVVHRGKHLGEIYPAKEVSGRHCFYLGCDERAEPRTYRGKIKAAQALHAIHKLIAQHKKKKWAIDQLIVMAWDERPRASDAS